MRLILTARVYDVAIESPITEAINLSNTLRNHVILKREDLQPVFSFKIRGAYNKMKHLSAEERARGVITCSAGNHAQGVAMASKKLGIDAIIIMPLCTPAIKWKNVERLGAQVVLFGDDFDEAKQECERRIQEYGYVYVPPYDDPLVIAGQGTIAVEIMRQVQRWRAELDLEDKFHQSMLSCHGQLQDSLKSGEAADVIFCAVGGGGMIAGMTAYIKPIYPNVRIVGVEAQDANSMDEAIKAGEPVALKDVGLFADGAAVRIVGKETFRVCYGNRGDPSLPPGIDEIVVVSNDEICAAIKDVFGDTRSVLEPAGALGVAGLKKWARMNEAKGLTLVAVTSGANMNFDRLRVVAERAALGENKEALISAIIPEKPGSFMKLYEAIYPRSVTEFSYRYGDPEKAFIFLSFGVQDRDKEIEEVLAKLDKHGMKGFDLTKNEMAKSHARYMVGGRQSVENERLFQFQFPEKPGALQKFLLGLQSKWNVSLFHYRNEGVDIGKVLVGVQVASEQHEQFDVFLSELGYAYVEETQNPIYEQFLR